MKKKLFLLLLIVALTAFVFTGCTPPAEGEGEGEGEIEGVLVEFGNEYRDGDKIYVRGGANNTVTVTFPAPVTGMVQVDLSNCTGDYSKGATYLFPNADRTVWTGSVYFACTYQIPNVCGDTCVSAGNDCCATTVTIISGACEADTCIAFPVIVDCDKPFAKLEVAADDCCCEDCTVIFKSVAATAGNDCAVCPTPADNCCGDVCSDLASWKIDVYKMKKKAYNDFTWPTETTTSAVDNITFEYCCEIVNCAIPVTTCEGEECPIECKLPCLDEDDYGESDAAGYYYFAIVTLKDNVGNTQKYYAALDISMGNTECEVKVYEGCCVTDKDNPNNSGMYWSDAYDCDAEKYFIGGCKGENPCAH